MALGGNKQLPAWPHCKGANRRRCSCKLEGSKQASGKPQDTNLAARVPTTTQLRHDASLRLLLTKTTATAGYTYRCCLLQLPAPVGSS
jgi:hypothetical protein